MSHTHFSKVQATCQVLLGNIGFGGIMVEMNGHILFLTRASCQVRKIACCACARTAGNVFPATDFKGNWHASRHVRHACAVMHVGIAKPRWRGKTFPAFPAYAQLVILRIWQEAMISHWGGCWLIAIWGLYNFG